MNDLRVEGLTKTVGDKTVLKNVSFIIHNGDRIGVIGTNGTGKSTLLDVISGISGFDGDRTPFSSKQNYTMAYLQQEPDFDDDKTVLDTVLSEEIRAYRLILDYEKIMADYTDKDHEKLDALMAEMALEGAWEIEHHVKAVLSRLGLANLNQPIRELSGGLKRRVQLAKVILGQEDLLLLDEPTNHLDIDTIAWLSEYLKSSKKTVLFITHDRYFLDQVATRVFELDKGRITEYQGNYQDYVRLKAQQDERHQSIRHKKERLYKKELEWMRRQPQARATKQEARVKRFKELTDDISRQETMPVLEMGFETSRIGKKVIMFEDVSFAYSDKRIIDHLHLLIQSKDRIGIVGDNGRGKTTLLHLMAGHLEPTSGQIMIGETVKVATLSQQLEGLDESKRIMTYLEEVAQEAVTVDGTVSISELLEQFLFPRSSHGTVIGQLSGGEKKRLYLLKLLLEKPNVLLLDEPTNDLDIATLTVLEQFLKTFQGPVVTVSHDRYFLDKVASKILAFEDGTIRPYYGNYSDYLDEKSFWHEKTPSEEGVPKVAVKKDKTEQKRMSYFEKKEWETIERDILALEEMIAVITQEMEGLGSDFTRLSELQKDLDVANDNLLEKYERYDYLSTLQ